MLKVYNTMSKKKEEFIPVDGKNINMYVCGITPYSDSHMGHARSEIAFDVIHRYLKYKGYNIKYAKNYTDIDDKIINRAKEENVDWESIPKKYIAKYEETLKKLEILTPNYKPKATEYIKEMISFIQGLEEKGYAYNVDGDVFFAVKRFKEYGKLSGIDIEEMLEGVRIDNLEGKKESVDFALWKKVKAGEPSWDSPWGDGRPGWHIECSTMIKALFNEGTIDIHGGGKDLVFPHHENEIAQSEALHSDLFAKYWIHNGHVTIDKEKMSKSLNNFTTIDDVISEYSTVELKMFFLKTHYRQPLDFNENILKEIQVSINRIYGFLAELDLYEGGKTGNDITGEVADLKNSFFRAFNDGMDDDFNTAMPIASLFSLIHKSYTLLSTKPTRESAEALKQLVKEVFQTISNTLGLSFLTYEEYYDSLLKIDKSVLNQKIEERIVARKNKDFNKADAIRDELNSLNIELMDTAHGTRYKVLKS